MGALLDTHALIWWIEGDDRITARLRQLLGSPQEDVSASAATAWEIATKVRIGKLQLAEEFLQNFLDAVEALGFRPLPISLRHGYEAAGCPGPTEIPFDRMLAAQALAEDLVLISADPAFNALGVSTFW